MKNTNRPVMIGALSLGCVAVALAVVVSSANSFAPKPADVVVVPENATPTNTRPPEIEKVKKKKILPLQLVSVPSLPNDPLRLLSSQKAFAGGKLAYVAQVPVKGNPDWQSFLILRELNGLSSRARTSTYHLKSIYGVFDPQFSPDGQILLLKIGSTGDRYDKYQIHLWNLRTRKEQAGPAEFLSYPRVRWSPDGRYIAYILGGDVTGTEWGEENPIRLCVYDVKSGTSREFARGAMVMSFDWTRQGSLLFSLGMEPQNYTMESEEDEMPMASQDVYEVSAANGAPELLIKDAYGACPSPDGKQVAFLGWPESENGAEAAQHKKSNLYIYNRINGKRTLCSLPVERYLPFDMQWTLDGKRLIILRTIEGSPSGKAVVTLMDVATLKTKDIATLHAKDFEPAPRNVTNIMFDPLEVSPTGAFLFVKVWEFTGVDPTDTSTAVEIRSLRAVNLRTGSVFTVAQVKDPEGIDWHEKAHLDSSVPVAPGR